MFLFFCNLYHNIIISNNYILSLTAICFLYLIYYVFFIKIKIHNRLLILVYIYYILYDIVSYSIICSSLISFILANYCYSTFLKFYNKNIYIRHYLVSGNIFFITNFMINLIFKEGNFLQLIIQCSLFSFITLVLLFIATNLNDKPKSIDYFVGD